MMSNDVQRTRGALHAMLFRFSLEELSNAYRTSMMVFEQRAASAEEVVRQQWGLSPDEPAPEVDYDEDGAPAFDFGEAVGEIEAEARSSQALVRTAFVVALFHFWERQANAWQAIPGEKYNHAATMAWLHRSGIQPRTEDLLTLQHVANCAKHGPGKSCDALAARCLDLFDLNRHGIVETPSDHNLLVTAKLVDAFFEAVSGSGPQLRSPWS